MGYSMLVLAPPPPTPKWLSPLATLAVPDREGVKNLVVQKTTEGGTAPGKTNPRTLVI